MMSPSRPWWRHFHGKWTSPSYRAWPKTYPYWISAQSEYFEFWLFWGVTSSWWHHHDHQEFFLKGAGWSVTLNIAIQPLAGGCGTCPVPRGCLSQKPPLLVHVPTTQAPVDFDAHIKLVRVCRGGYSVACDARQCKTPDNFTFESTHSGRGGVRKELNHP